MLTRYGFSGPSPPWRSPCEISVPANFPATENYLPKGSLASGKLRLLATLARYLERALGDDAAADAPAPEASGDEEEAPPPHAASATASTAGDEALARRLAMGLPPRRSTGRGAAAASLPAPPPRKSAKARRPPRETSDDDSDAGESSDDEAPISVWQAQAAAEQPAPAKAWAVGDRVEAKFLTAGQVGSASARYSREFYPATISTIHGATCDVEYDTSDEEMEEHLPLRHVRKRRRAPAAPPAAESPRKKKKKAPAKTHAAAPSDERSRLIAQCLARGIQHQGHFPSAESMREQLAAYAGPAPEEDVAIGAGDACFCRWGEKMVWRQSALRRRVGGHLSRPLPGLEQALRRRLLHGVRAAGALVALLY